MLEAGPRLLSANARCGLSMFIFAILGLMKPALGSLFSHATLGNKKSDLLSDETFSATRLSTAGAAVVGRKET